jgi:drug/metabolite transporter (DMT)-like permease
MPAPRSGLSRYDAGMLLVCLIWGANFSAIKYALEAVPPLVFAALRFILASVVFLVLVRVREGPLLRTRTGSIRGLILLGLIGNTFYQAGFMIGLDETTATKSALILAAMPVMVAVIATIFGVERLSGRLWAGMALALVGVVVVIGTRSGTATAGGSLTGDLLMLLACLCWSVYTVGLRRVGSGMSSLRVTAVTTVAGTPGLVLLALPQFREVSWGSLDAGTWFGVFYSGLLAIVVAYTLWSVSVRVVGSSRTAVYNAVIPVVAALVAWVVLGEKPSLTQAGGAALVITGVMLSQSRGRQSGLGKA